MPSTFPQRTALISPIFVAEAEPFDFGVAVAFDEADVYFARITVFVEDHGAARQFGEEHPAGAFVV